VIGFLISGNLLPKCAKWAKAPNIVLYFTLEKEKSITKACLMTFFVISGIFYVLKSSVVHLNCFNLVSHLAIDADSDSMY
jgi:hypothetical protein